MATHGAVGMQQASPMNMPQHARSVGAVRQLPESGNYAQPPNNMQPQMMPPHQMHPSQMQQMPPQQMPQQMPHMGMQMPMDQMGMMQQHMQMQQIPMHDNGMQMQQYPQEEGMVPMDEPVHSESHSRDPPRPVSLDPPEEGEPPSLSKRAQMEGQYYAQEQQAPMHHQQQPGMNGVYPPSYGAEQMHGYPPHDQMHGYPPEQHEHAQMAAYQSHEQPMYQSQEPPQMNGYHEPDPNMNGYEGPPTPNYNQEPHYPNAENHGMHYPDEGNPNMHAEQAVPYYGGEEMPADQYYHMEGQHTGDSDEYQNSNVQYSEGNTSDYYPNQHEGQQAHPQEAHAPPVQMGPQESPSTLKYEYSVEESEQPEGRSDSPEVSEANTRSSVQSQAMRGARELLKRNRQKRLEMVAKQASPKDEEPAQPDMASPKSEVSGGTWESGSEVSESVVSATSSAWTETSGAPERSSRRALILQMAKARMKSNKSSGGSTVGDTPRSEIMGTYSITEEEKKLDGPIDDQATEIDMAGDLD
mmetsp:Transcript_24225/g.55577  ORF Transcript_24225/g.55577 Transcript_24225/m.55577 type:complete len:524 (-) Transcript_24225:163-1734(-)